MQLTLGIPRYVMILVNEVDIRSFTRNAPIVQFCKRVHTFLHEYSGKWHKVNGFKMQ